MYKTNFELHMPEPLKVLMKLVMRFYMCLHKSLGRGPHGKLVLILRLYFWQVFISLALRKCKKDCKILKGILRKGYCPQKKMKLLDFLSDIVLISFN